MSIQKMRRDKGWSQEELSLHTGLSVRTVQRIENGKTASLESLKCLAAVLETSVSFLTQEQTMTTLNTTNSQTQYFVDEAELDAIAYVQNIKAFHLNWICFLIIMPCLVAVNLTLSPGFLWVIIAGLGWGLGIGLHALTIFGLFSIFGGKWEQKEFQKRLNSQK